MINTNINNLITEMDNPFNGLSKKFDLLQALKTIGLAFVPFGNIVSLHNCYKRTLDTPIETKVIGFGGQLLTSMLFAPAFILIYPMIYLLCLQSSREETMKYTNTINIFKKLAIVYAQGIPEDAKIELDYIDAQTKAKYKELSTKFAKLSNIETDEAKKDVIYQYGVVTFDGLSDRLKLFQKYLNKLNNIQNDLLKEIKTEYNTSRSAFFKGYSS